MTQQAENSKQVSSITFDNVRLSAVQADFLGYLQSKDTASQVTRTSRTAALIYMRSYYHITTRQFNQLWAEFIKRGWLKQYENDYGDYYYEATDAAREAYADFVNGTQPTHDALDSFYALDAELQSLDVDEAVAPLLDDLETKLLGVMETHVAPAEPDTLIPSGLDETLEAGLDPVMCAGYLRRLADALEAEEGNDYTCYALRTSAGHLVAGVAA